jgi:hypothetical protein
MSHVYPGPRCRCCCDDLCPVLAQLRTVRLRMLAGWRQAHDVQCTGGGGAVRAVPATGHHTAAEAAWRVRVCHLRLEDGQLLHGSASTRSSLILPCCLGAAYCSQLAMACCRYVCWQHGTRTAASSSRRLAPQMAAWSLRAAASCRRAVTTSLRSSLATSSTCPH